jgi:VWFA-related protein
MFRWRAQCACRALAVASVCAMLLLVGPLALWSQSSSTVAQASPAPAVSGATAAANPPTISTAADEVALDLVVRTKNGKPILDLKREDLAITDAGAPVKLSDLHLVNGATETNHLVTLVFDRLDPAPAKAARDLAGKILRAIPTQGYSFAVFQMNGRLQLVQAFTTQQDAVQLAINHATAPPTALKSGELTPAEKDLMATHGSDSLSADFENRARNKLLLSALEEYQRILDDQHAYPSLGALLALARTQRQITGRKLVIYFAQGLYANSDARDTINSVVGQANKAGVTICAIDTNAMNQQMGDKMMGAMAMAGAGPGSAISNAMALGAHGYGEGQSGPPIGQVMDAAQNMTSMEFDSMDDVKSPLIKLASGTGGIYIRAGANAKKPIQELHDELTTYYEAAYTPNIKSYDGAFRPIVIQSLRKGMVVQSRAGYFALPPDNGAGIRPYEVPLLSIFAEPTLPTQIGFASRILHLGQLPDGNSSALAVQVPVSELQVHDDGNTHLSSVHVTILAQIKNDKGALVQRFSEDIPRHEAPDVLKSASGQFITMERHFSADPGTYTLETAVMDRIGNKSAAQRSTFTVDAIPKGPALSDMALVREVEPVHADTASFDPMRYMNGRVIPNLTEEMPEGTKDLSVFFLVHLLPAGGRAPELTMEIFRNGESVGKLPLELSTTESTGAIPYLGAISGRVFPPGNYRIVTTLSQNGQTASSSTAFQVEGTIAASNAPAAVSFSASGATDAVADQKLTSEAAASKSKFVITASKNPVPPPTEAEAQAIIEAARQRALAWSESLPNFFCVEITDHSVDPSGAGDWHHKDTLVQLMRYVDHQESRTTLELNGAKSTVAADDLDFAHSIGEFGGIFLVVFNPTAQAKFTWKESDVLDGAPVQVFNYKVEQAHSDFSVNGFQNREIAVAFHGTVYLDAATHSVRRVTIDADNIPSNLMVHASSMSVDYGWVSINNHDFLMPTEGAISLREGKHQAVLNEFEFRNYRRFGSQVRILSTAESQALKKQQQPQ